MFDCNRVLGLRSCYCIPFYSSSIVSMFEGSVFEIVVFEIITCVIWDTESRESIAAKTDSVPDNVRVVYNSCVHCDDAQPTLIS